MFKNIDPSRTKCLNSDSLVLLEKLRSSKDSELGLVLMVSLAQSAPLFGTTFTATATAVTGTSWKPITGTAIGAMEVMGIEAMKVAPVAMDAMDAMDAMGMAFAGMADIAGMAVEIIVLATGTWTDQPCGVKTAESRSNTARVWSEKKSGTATPAQSTMWMWGVLTPICWHHLILMNFNPRSWFPVSQK